MRKTIILALLAATVAPVAAPVAASAQTHELRRDREQIREERQELRDAQRYGDRRDVREERRDLREARREHRQDWRDYRRDNRNVYARGHWNAPFRYRAWNTGVQLRPSYYSSRYYVTNYSRYRLPAPGWNQRYIRHYDDVLLVNVRNGRVVRVYRNFFW